LTQFLHSIGDDTSRVDRQEPDVNETRPANPRDTTTPEAMVQSMKTILSAMARRKVAEENPRT